MLTVTDPVTFPNGVTSAIIFMFFYVTCNYSDPFKLTYTVY